MTAKPTRRAFRAAAMFLAFAMILQALPIAAVQAAGVRLGDPSGLEFEAGSSSGYEEIPLGETALGYVPGELIVRLTNEAAKSMGRQAGKSAAQRDGEDDGDGFDVFSSFGLSVGEILTISGLESEDYSLRLFSLPEEADMEEVLEVLRQDPNVEYVEPNYIFSTQDEPVSPNDPLYSDQWGLIEIQALKGWQKAEQILGGATATPITVAVVDTGVDYSHGDLSSRMAEGGYNAIEDVIGQAAADDNSYNSHGTRVAGIIAAATDNGTGIAGVAGPLPVSILPVKALDRYGYGTMLQISNSIRWAADHNVRIINLSLGARLSDFPTTLSDAVRYAQDKGVLIVAAAGNDALQYGAKVDGFYPACLPGVVAVSASAEGQKLAAFSNVDDSAVAAPGVDVLSTIKDNKNGDGEDDYANSTGTSFASPAVAGIAAAILSVCPDYTSAGVVSMISSGSKSGSGGYYGIKIADLYGAFGKTPNPGNYLGMIEPADEAVLSGIVNITVVAKNPDNVHHIVFQAQATGDYSSDPTVIATVNGPLASGTVGGSGVYTAEWDTLGEDAGVPDGQYDVEACLYMSESDLYPSEYAGATVTILNGETGGLSIQVKKPIEGSQAEPKNASFVPVVVAHCTIDASGKLNTELVWRGTTDGDGFVFIPRSVATHGNDYLVMANGTDPGFLYMKTLRSPGSYTLTANDAHKVTLSAVTAEGDPLAGAAVRADVLRGNISGVDDSQARLVVPREYTWDDGEDVFLVGHVDGQGISEFYVSPGMYDFAVMDEDRLCFFSKRGLTIDGDYSGSFGGPSELSLITLAPDSDTAFNDFDLVVSDGQRHVTFPNLGTNAVTISAGTYELEVTAARRGISVDNSDYDYFLGLSRTIMAGATGGSIPFEFGYIASATVQPVNQGDPEADPPELLETEFAIMDCRFYDSFGNLATSLFRRQVGYDSKQHLTFNLIVERLTQEEPIQLWTLPPNFDEAQYKWYVYDDGHGYHDGTAHRVSVSIDTEASLGSGNLLGSATSPYAPFNIIRGSLADPWSLRVRGVGDLCNQALDVTRMVLVRKEGGAYKEIAELKNNEKLGGDRTCYLEEWLDPLQEYGLIIVGETLNPDNEDGPAQGMVFYHPIEYGPEPMTIDNIHTAGDDWTRLNLKFEDEIGNQVSDYAAYSAHICLTKDVSPIGGFLKETDGGLYSIWLQKGTHAIVQAWRTIPSPLAGGGYFAGSSKPNILASASVSVPGSGDDEISVTLGGGGLAELVPYDVQSDSPKDHTASAIFFGEVPDGLVVWGPIYVTPGDYLVQTMVPVPGTLGYWTYWYLREETDVEGQRTIGAVSDQLLAELTLDAPPDEGYGAGDILRSTHKVTAGAGNTLVGMIPRHISDGTAMSLNASDPGAQTHAEPAPFLVIRSAVPGSEAEVFRYKDVAEHIGRWADAVLTTSAIGMTAKRLGDGTYSRGEWTIPEDLPAGTYTATLEIGAGPGIGDVQSAAVFFTVTGAPGAPAITGVQPPSPTNATSVTVSGNQALPGSLVTVSYVMSGDDPETQSTVFGTAMADSQGGYSVTGDLDAEGTYVFTAVVTLDDLTGPPSAPLMLVIDRTPTALPYDLQATSPAATQMNLSWKAPQGSTAGELDRFLIYRDGQYIGQVPATGSEPWGFVDADCLGGTTYTYSVSAVDKAGNESSLVTVEATTVTTGDTEPPSAPTSLAAAFEVGGTVRLTWGKSTDNVGVKGYRIYMHAGSLPDDPPDELLDDEIDHVADQEWYSHTIIGLAAEQAYTFWVTAMDNADNESPLSNYATGTTGAMFITSFTANVPKTKDKNVKMDGDWVLTVVGETGRSVTVNVSATSWIDEAEQLLPEPQDRTYEVTLAEQLDGQGKGTGVYRSTWTLPSGIAQISEVEAVMSDGTASLGPTRKLAGLSEIAVAGALQVTVNLLESELARLGGGTLLVWDEVRNTGAVTALTDAGVYTVTDLSPADDYRLEVRSPGGQTLYVEGSIPITSGLVNELTIAPPLPAAISFRVIDDSGLDRGIAGVTVSASSGEVGGSRLTDEAGYALQYGGQHLIPFVKSGSVVNWSVSVPQTLRHLYRPASGTIVVEPGVNNKAVTLPSVESTLVFGKVIDQTGKPLAGAHVMAVFTLDGISLTLNTEADGAGDYEMQVPALNNVSLYHGHRLARQVHGLYDLTGAVGGDYELNVTLSRDAVIVASINLRKAGSTTPIPLAAMPGMGAMLNVDTTNGSAKWIGFGVDLPEIRVPYCSPGDEILIQIHGESRNVGIVPVDATVTLDENLSATVKLDLEERGRIVGEVSKSGGALLSGVSRTAAIYSSTGSSATPISITTFSERSYVSPALPELPDNGKYTVVFHWTEPAVISNWEQYDAPRNFGYWSGPSAIPHVIYEVAVENGELANLGQVSIPENQWSGGYYFPRATNTFTSNVSVAAPGSVVTYRLAYSYEKIPASHGELLDLVLNATIPNGSTYVAGSATLKVIKGRDDTQFQIGDYGISVDLGNDTVDYNHLEGTLTYQVRMPDNPAWPTVQASAMANFRHLLDTGYVNGRESLGTMQVDVPFLSIQAPDKTTSNVINLTGTAVPNSAVRVYDGTWFVGETVARSYGVWQMQNVLLPDRGTPGNHYLIATMGSTSDDGVLPAEGVVYSKPVHVVTGTADPIALRVKMTQSRTLYPQGVSFYPALGVSTHAFAVKPGWGTEYQIFFDDPTRVANVRIVVKSATREEVGYAEFDTTVEDGGAYVAHCYEMGRIYLRYDVLPKQYVKPTSDPDPAILLSAMPNAWRDADYEVEPLAEGRPAGLWVQDDEQTYQPVGAFRAVSATMGGTGVKVGITVSWEEVGEYTPTPIDQALEAAGGPPVYGLTVTKVREEAPGILEVSWIMPVSAATATAGSGARRQSFSAQGGLHTRITVRAETPVHGGLGVADLYSTIMSGVDYKNKMDQLNRFLDRVDSNCEGGAPNTYYSAADGLANRLLGNLFAKYALQGAGMALSATGVGVVGTIAIWAISSVAAEIADSKWERDFQDLKTAAAGDEECKRDDDDPDDDNWNDRPTPKPDPPNPDKPIADPYWMIDPSGYLYEGVESERVEGAEATVLEKVGDEQFVQWQDIWLGQLNPQITDVEGRYGWDVPEGYWMVTYEKEGYLNAASEVMYIPPPRTDVNIGMTSLSAPAVASVDARTGGTHIEIEFSKYLKVSTVNGATFRIFEDSAIPGEDDPLEGSVVAVEAQEDPSNPGVMLAKRFKFVPGTGVDLTVGDSLTLIVDGAAQAYSGIPMGTGYSTTVTIQNVPTDPGGPTDPTDPPDPGDDYGDGPGYTPQNPNVNRFVVLGGMSHLEAFGGSVVLDFEAGTFGPLNNVTVEMVGTPGGATYPGTGDGLTLLSAIYDITAEQGRPDKPVLLTIKYDPALLGDLDPHKIGVYMQDPVNPAKWTFVGGVVDPVNCTVSVWLTHFSKYAVMANDARFTDMSDHWAKNEVSTLASKSIVGGVGEGKYDPERAVTRAEMAKILVNSLKLDARRGIELISPATPAFSDVPAHEWYYSYVETAASLGLVTGFEGKFRPDDPVTREEMAALAVRALDVEDKVSILEGREPAFEDSPSFSTWAKKYVLMAMFKGVMRGNTPTTFDPQGYTTRAQAAVVVIRILERLGLLSKTEVFKGKIRYSEVEGPHIEMEVKEGDKTVTYVLLPEGGPDGQMAARFDGVVGMEIRVLAVRQEGASIYMSGPVLRVLEVWKPNCPLCPPE